MSYTVKPHGCQETKNLRNIQKTFVNSITVFIKRRNQKNYYFITKLKHKNWNDWTNTSSRKWVDLCWHSSWNRKTESMFPLKMKWDDAVSLLSTVSQLDDKPAGSFWTSIRSDVKSSIPKHGKPLMDWIQRVSTGHRIAFWCVQRSETRRWKCPSSIKR